MNRTTRHALRALAAANGILLASAAGAASVPGVTDTEVTIGAHTNESGAFAQFATFGKGLSAYFDKVNENGGINGRKIKFIRSDCVNENAKCLESTKALVERDNVFAMVGSQGSAHIAVYQYLIDKGVPDLFIGDGTSAYLAKKSKTVFPAYYPWPVEAKTIVEHFAKTSPGKKLCALQSQTPLGEEYTTGAFNVARELNAKKADTLKIGPVVKVDKASVQADSEVLSLKQAGCELVLLTTAGTLTASVINFGATNGFRPTWAVQTFNVNPKFISLLNEDARDGIISATHVAKEPKLGGKDWANFEKLMKEKNVPASGNSATGYAIAEMFTETLRRAGRNLTRESIIKAAESLKGYQCSLCLLPMNTTPGNHWPFASAKIIVTKGGEWTIY